MKTIEVNTLTALKSKVLVHNVEQGEKVTRGGVIITDDDGKERGIRERWAQIYAVGSDVDDLSVGQWILIKHGRWSRGISVAQNGNATTIRQVEYPDAILLVSDQNPLEN